MTCLDDYHPVAVTPIITKCCERLILSHIESAIPADLDQHQFAYRANRSAEDAVNTMLHTWTSPACTCCLWTSAQHLTPSSPVLPPALWEELQLDQIRDKQTEEQFVPTGSEITTSVMFSDDYKGVQCWYLLRCVLYSLIMGVLPDVDR